MAKLIIATRYVAVFALIVAILLIIVRAKFPQKESTEGTISYWRAIWRALRERHHDQRKQASDFSALRGKTALLVDPDEKSARVMSWRLESWQCNMLSADKGAMGLNLARENKIDFVVVDALLSDISAQDFYRSLARPDIPVLFVGARDTQYDELKHLGSNTRCFGKPYDPDEVLALAGYLLRSNKDV